MDSKVVNMIAMSLLLVGFVAILAMAFKVPIFNLDKNTLLFLGVACVGASGLVKGFLEPSDKG